jgi:putative ABC transport system permease protein
VLKNKFAGTPKHGSSRSALVVTQFVISIFIMAGTVVVYNQLHFIQTKKIGFDREEVLLVRGTNALQSNKDAFRQEVEQVAGVKQAIYAGFLPVANSARNDNSYSTSPVMDAKNGFNLQSWVADENYIPFMGMKMVSGRNFSKDFATDSNAVVINETAARLMGFGKEAVGKKLYAVDNGPDGLRTISFNIIGVVSNFNFESLRQTIGPLMIRYGKADWIIACKLNAASARQSIADIESKWKTMAPGQPFVYAFMNEWFDDMYRIEQRTSKLGLSFAIIAILIACLGLFGLATFMAEQRTKEIGVRKVLGASVGQIVLMMSKKFVLLVAVAAAVALPLAWWIMGIWLQDFAYRPALGWWVFGLAALLAFVVAILTVSTQAIKAALANPVKSLRTE